MTEFGKIESLIVSFPAAGAGSTTFQWLESCAARRGAVYVSMLNADSVDALVSRDWHEGTLDEIQQVVDRTRPEQVVLVGHSMGGLSAFCLSHDLGSRIARPIGTLLINTPCPDAEGRIPTMSECSDSEIGEMLADDGFPEDLISDKEMLSEVSAGLRSDANVADFLAVSVSETNTIGNLHVLATRDDRFIGTSRCAMWRDWASHEFHLIVEHGGHMLNGTPFATLERTVGSVIASVRGA
ncbi:alpha/beta fold hydrolase [Actinopolyspora xinjiangensis]|uniref:thioesterase II family protein n=1 Tax=Actinopolyspora xinjiangensis TaxID=405564 RepID=UPI001481B11C